MSDSDALSKEPLDDSDVVVAVAKKEETKKPDTKEEKKENQKDKKEKSEKQTAPAAK